MSTDEQDYSKIPLETRWYEKAWKARHCAYTESMETLSSLEPKYPTVDQLRSASGDANVIALELGIKLLNAVLDKSDDYQYQLSVQKACLPLVMEKGLAAAKPAVKQASSETILKFVEVGEPKEVVQTLIAGLQHKSPKIVVSTAGVLNTVFKEFGSPVTDPKPVLQVLNGMFGHADRNVRSQAIELAVSMSRWVGESTVLQVLKSLKQVQLDEIKGKIAKSDFSQPVPRLTRAQAMANQEAENGGANDSSMMGGDDSQMGDESEIGSSIDPWELEAASKINIPGDFFDLLGSNIWKERRAAIDGLIAAVGKATKFEEADNYTPVINGLAAVIEKDANTVVVGQALIALKLFIGGLRPAFQQYVPKVVNTLVERFKDKKVAAAITESLNMIFFDVCKEDYPLFLEGFTLGQKAPNARLESAKFLGTLICKAKYAPGVPEIKKFAPSLVKLLGEPSEPVRAASATVLGALAKIYGMPAILPFLGNIDEHKKKRVEAVVEKITVNAVPKSNKQAASKSKAAPAEPGMQKKPIPSRMQRPTDGSPRREPIKRPLQRRPGPVPAGDAPRAPAPSAAPGRKPISGIRSSVNASNGSSRVPGVTSPVRPITSSARMEDRPNQSSTPKIVKRGLQTTDFTPVRQLESSRRRVYSPAVKTSEYKDPHAAILAERLELANLDIAKLREENVKMAKEMTQMREAHKLEVDELMRENSKLNYSISLMQSQKTRDQEDLSMDSTAGLDQMRSQLMGLQVDERGRSNLPVKTVNHSPQLGQLPRISINSQHQSSYEPIFNDLDRKPASGIPRPESNSISSIRSQAEELLLKAKGMKARRSAYE